MTAHQNTSFSPALLAGAVSGILGCYSNQPGGSSVLAGLLTGYLAGWLCRRILVITARSNFIPATASSIITAGGSGILAALAGALLFHAPSLYISKALHAVLGFLESPLREASSGTAVLGLLQVITGTAVGAAMCWGSQVGLYHLVFLPLICFEMEHGHPSFLAAVDWCSLCLVSGGICLAVYVSPPPTSAFTSSNPASGVVLDPRPLARRGAFINLCFGDFVEACYPFFQTSPFLTVVVYLSCIISTILLLMQGGKSSAYLPLPLSLWLADGKANAAALVAFGLPFTATLLRNLAFRVF